MYPFFPYISRGISKRFTEQPSLSFLCVRSCFRSMFFWMSLIFFWNAKSKLSIYRNQPKKSPGITAKDSANRVFESLKNKNFRLLFIGTLIASAIQGTGQVFDTYMNVFFWEFSTEEIAWFSVAAMVGVTAALLTIKATSKKIRKKRHIYFLFIDRFHSSNS